MECRRGPALKVARSRTVEHRREVAEPLVPLVAAEVVRHRFEVGARLPVAAVTGQSWKALKPFAGRKLLRRGILPTVNTRGREVMYASRSPKNRIGTPGVTSDFREAEWSNARQAFFTGRGEASPPLAGRRSRVRQVTRYSWHPHLVEPEANGLIVVSTIASPVVPRPSTYFCALLRTHRLEVGETS